MKTMITHTTGQPLVRSLRRSLATLGVATVLVGTGLSFAPPSRASASTLNAGTDLTSATSAVASVTSAAGIAVGTRSPRAAQVAQATLTLTSISGTVGTALTLTTSGGSGTGALSFAITSSGSASCLISGTKVSATRAGTCVVTATKAADTTYLASSSAATTVTFVAAPPLNQAPLVLTSTKGSAGVALILTARGGSGTGALSFAITSSGSASCLISNAKVSATRAGTCSLVATKAADATYLSASSPVTTVTFAAAPLRTQAALILTSTSDTAGTSLTLTSSGGSGAGLVTYGVTNAGTAGCWIVAGALNATRAGTCSVTATKAANGIYAVGRSAATTVMVLAKAGPTAVKVIGSVWTGRTVNVTIIGAGFFNRPLITSNEARTVAAVIHDNGSSLVVRVTLARGAAQGWHVFTITEPNGQSCKVRYLVKVGLSATKVNGYVWTGRTVNVTIIGAGFYRSPSIRSNEASTVARVIHDNGSQLVLRVSLPLGAVKGWHVFTITEPNGQSCKVRYLVK